MSKRKARRKPYVPATEAEKAWNRRAGRYRREVANWCELCEWRDIKIGRQRHKPWFTWPGHLAVHHGNARDFVSPLGYESDDELTTLCRRCHARITRRQFRIANRHGYCKGRRVLDLAGYSWATRKATEKASVRRWARGWHRTLLGPVPRRNLDRRLSVSYS